MNALTGTAPAAALFDARHCRRTVRPFGREGGQARRARRAADPSGGSTGAK